VIDEIIFQSGKSLPLNALAFAYCETCVIREDVPALTAFQRFQRKLIALVRDEGHGVKAKLAGACGKESPSWVSNLLKPEHRSKTPMVSLDDIDCIAAYFGISVGQLLGTAKPGDLTGDESRLVQAFQVLPPATQEHFLAVIEAAALGAHLARTRPSATSTAQRRHAQPPPPSAATRAPATRALVTEFIDNLISLVSPTEPRGQAPAPDPFGPVVRPGGRSHGGSGAHKS
jgi:hypothetical protein